MILILLLAWPACYAITTPTGIQYNVFTYAGQAKNTVTHTMILGGYRAYNPMERVFLKKDSINALVNQQTHNGFNYAMGNPILQIDPTGHISIHVGVQFFISIIVLPAILINHDYVIRRCLTGFINQLDLNGTVNALRGLPSAARTRWNRWQRQRRNISRLEDHANGEPQAHGYYRGTRAFSIPSDASSSTRINTSSYTESEDNAQISDPGLRESHRLSALQRDAEEANAHVAESLLSNRIDNNGNLNLLRDGTVTETEFL